MKKEEVKIEEPKVEQPIRTPEEQEAYEQSKR